MKLLFLLIFICANSYAQEKLPIELEALIKKSKGSKEFINALPAKFRDHYVLLYEGHAGTKASVSEPRMIFYDDKTLISVGRNEIEGATENLKFLPETEVMGRVVEMFT